MNKIAVSFLIICVTLSTVACTNSSKTKDNSIIDLNSYSIINNEKEPNTQSSISGEEKTNNLNRTVNIIKMPIILMPRDTKEEKNIKYLEINEDSPLQEKIELIVNAISKECFNGLPINVTFDGDDIAKVELVELENLENSRVSWKEDYLNDQIKEYTLNVILKNMLQEDYKGHWVDKVQLYYEGELISLN